MNNSGDAAEQIVRLSLEGMEVTAKLTGTAAKHIAVILLSVLKQEQKTRGKARLSSMIKSGKELKVFAVPQGELKKFIQHAKQYGVLYCVLKDKENENPDAIVDIIARAEDAAKIQRIFDRFEIGKVKHISFNGEDEKDIEHTNNADADKKEAERPFGEKTNKDSPSEKRLENADMQNNKRTSVKEKLNKYRRTQPLRQYGHEEMKKDVIAHEK